MARDDSTPLFRVRHMAETSSTNLEIKQAITAEEPEGLAVYADVQTGGYGRQGRGWVSPKGGLYVSFLLRPDASAAELPTLALAASVAVARALRSVVGEADAASAQRIGVKWPNDVLLDGTGDEPRKLCGISCEVVGGAVCLGIGVNVLVPAEGAFEKSAYVCELFPAVTVEGVLDALVRELALVYGAWSEQGFAAVYDDYCAFDVLVGREVRIVDIAGHALAGGMVQSVDEQGRLVLCGADGSTQRVSSGEAHILW